MKIRLFLATPAARRRRRPRRVDQSSPPARSLPAFRGCRQYDLLRLEQRHVGRQRRRRRRRAGHSRRHQRHAVDQPGKPRRSVARPEHRRRRRLEQQQRLHRTGQRQPDADRSNGRHSGTGFTTIIVQGNGLAGFGGITGSVHRSGTSKGRRRPTSPAPTPTARSRSSGPWELPRQRGFLQRERRRLNGRGRRPVDLGHDGRLALVAERATPPTRLAVPGADQLCLGRGGAYRRDGVGPPSSVGRRWSSSRGGATAARRRLFSRWLSAVSRRLSARSILLHS